MEKLRAIFEDELNNGILAPSFMRNKSDLTSQDDIVGRLPVLEPDTVIVGVIDTGIALGHRSTRLPDGTTRFIASWQQSAARSVSGQEIPGQGHLPVGRELFANDINELLETHSVGGLKDGWLDEEAFNRAAGLVDFSNPYGHRELARRAAHGTHVLGHAAGYDATQDSALAKFADKIRIIAVNLPDRNIVGLSGSFLEQYVGLAVARIILLERLLVVRASEDLEGAGLDSENFSFPLIINLSFGKQAGPRDGEEPIARLISKINDTQSIIPVDRGGVFFTIPAGNDNLLQGNSAAELVAGAEREMKWRIHPEDQTPNYVEIWSEAIEGIFSDGEPIPLQIAIDLPNGVAWSDLHKGRSRDDTQTRDGHIDEIENVVRIYCKIKSLKLQNDSNGELIDCFRVHYLLCVAPTMAQDGVSATAPAGVWKVKLKNQHSGNLKFFANVQTDQSAVPDGVTGLRSCFEDEDYVRIDETTGRLLDTYPYSDDEEAAIARARFGRGYLGHDSYKSMVKRHGTLNALAIDRRYSIVVGGYRATDGASAIYSATGFGDRIGRYMGAPTLAMVTDDGPAYPGILSEGARDGSVVAMRGTSFAAPQITKKIAELLVDGVTDLNPKTWINAQSQQTYPDGKILANERRFSQAIDIDKGGRGRFPQSNYRGLNRLGLEDVGD
ncbi:MAG: hypothetical protein AAF950_18045 [Pseudomonadota bacterium]